MAWFDDLRLEEVSQDPIRPVLETVTKNYALRGADSGMVVLLADLAECQPDLSEVWLEGLARGWPEGKSPRFTQEKEAEMACLYPRFSEKGQTALLRLLARWNRIDLAGDGYKKRVVDLREQVADSVLPDLDRYEAAGDLLALADTPETLALLLGILDPRESPMLQEGIVAVLGRSHLEEVGPNLLGKWRRLTPLVRSKAIDLILRHPSWISDLVEALEAGRVSRTDLSVLQARNLGETASPELAERAAIVLQGKAYASAAGSARR